MRLAPFPFASINVLMKAFVALSNTSDVRPAASKVSDTLSHSFSEMHTSDESTFARPNVNVRMRIQHGPKRVVPLLPAPPIKEVFGLAVVIHAPADQLYFRSHHLSDPGIKASARRVKSESSR